MAVAQLSSGLDATPGSVSRGRLGTGLGAAALVSANQGSTNMRPRSTRLSKLDQRSRQLAQPRIVESSSQARRPSGLPSRPWAELPEISMLQLRVRRVLLEVLDAQVNEHKQQRNPYEQSEPDRKSSSNHARYQGERDDERPEPPQSAIHADEITKGDPSVSADRYR
jgi:hypothetical protein